MSTPNKNVLEEFRKEWKNELAQPKDVCNIASSSNDTTLQKPLISDIQLAKPLNLADFDSSPDVSQDGFLNPNNASSLKFETDANEYFPFQILTHFLNEAPKKKKDSPHARGCGKSKTNSTYCKRKYFTDSSLQANSKEKKTKVQREQKEITSNSSGGKGKGYLDLFIADLDDINEIPFFDTTVAREVAMKIFQHLDMRTLCMCSQVSRSWRSLADDEFLWCQICHELGYDTDIHISEREGWKVAVQDHLDQKRMLRANWKERVGKPYHLNYAQGGVLCAVSSRGSHIIAGYSGCSVRCWDTETGDSCTLTASNTAPVIDESTEDLGLIKNEVIELSMTASVYAASYRHGHVDIWHRSGGTEPTHTLTFRNPKITTMAACDLRPSESWVAAAQTTRVQVAHIDQHGGRILSDFDMKTPVAKALWYESPAPAHPPQLLLSCGSSVYLKNMEAHASHTVSTPICDITDRAVTEIHHIIWAPVSCIGCRGGGQEVAVGYTVAQPASKVKLSLYDLSTANHKATLSGHTWVITCMHLPEAQPYQLVTGSGDRKIRLFDLRSGNSPTLHLPGHTAKVTCVEMDEWKVVSGDEAGFVCVWDQRMGKKLWDIHNRHPVQYCHSEGRLLVIGHVPYVKFLHDDDVDGNIASLRYRGTVQVYDFLAQQLRQGLPDVCLSTYEEPEASLAGIGLAVPYDSL